MICSFCYKDFPEKEIEESHDVPCYLFWDKAKTRREQKNLADKFPRHWLCKECHKLYDESLLAKFRIVAFEYSKELFSGRKK